MFHRLGYLPLIFEEPRRTEVAVEMIINDNYVVPTINDIYYYNKPPLHNWVLAATFSLFNSYSEFAARATTIMSFLFVGLLVFYISRQFLSVNSAWLAMIFTLTTGDILYRFSLLAEIDVFYTLLVLLQGLSIIYFWNRRNLWLLFIVSYLFCAAGFLTKGMTSLAFQALTLLGWGIGFGQFRKLFSLQHIAGILALASVLLIYFGKYSEYHDPLVFISKLLTESSEKTISNSLEFDFILKWLTFPVMFLQVILPWAIILLLIDRKYVQRIMSNDLLKFSLIFIAVNLIVYWISPGTRPRYLYPFVPFAMILLGDLAHQNLFKARFSKVIEYLLGFIILISGLGALVAPTFELPEAIVNPWLICIVSGGLMIILAYLYFKHSSQRIWIFVAFMITLRVSFNFIVLPVRKIDIVGRMDFKSIVDRIIVDSDENRLRFYAPRYVETLKPVFFGIPFPEREHEYIEWPPFQLSFYYAANTSQILSLAPLNDRDGLFLADSNNLINEKIEILNTYSIEGKGKKFVLFRFQNPNDK